MHRWVRNVILVLRIGRHRIVLVYLIGIVGISRQWELAPVLIIPTRERCTIRLHLAKVDHRPAELTLHRYRHDLVINMVIIPINRKMESLTLIVDTRIPLRGIFRIQLRIAHQGIVQVVERRSSEDALVEGTEYPLIFLIRQEEHRCEFLQGSSLPHRMVLYMRIEQCHIRLQTSIRADDGKQRLWVDAIHITETIDITIEVRPSQVGTCRHRKIGRVEGACHRTIHVLLGIVIITIHSRRIGGWVLQIVQVIISILQVRLQAPSAPQLLIRSLDKEVLVPLPIRGIPLVGKTTNDRSRQSSVWIVIVGMKRQPLVESSSLQTIEGDVGVVPHANRIFWSRLKSEFVVTVRMLVLTIEEEVILQREISFHLIQTERTIAILHLCGGTVWSFGLHIDGGSRSILWSRLQSLILVGIV